jgi:hypothetical protein
MLLTLKPTLVIMAGCAYVNEVRDEQLKKQLLPKYVTPGGIIMDVRPKHLLKQLLPKYVTPRGILMDVRF